MRSSSRPGWVNGDSEASGIVKCWWVAAGVFGFGARSMVIGENVGFFSGFRASTTRCSEHGIRLFSLLLPFCVWLPEKWARIGRKSFFVFFFSVWVTDIGQLRGFCCSTEKNVDQFCVPFSETLIVDYLKCCGVCFPLENACDTFLSLFVLNNWRENGK